MLQAFLTEMLKIFPIMLATRLLNSFIHLAIMLKIISFHFIVHHSTRNLLQRGQRRLGLLKQGVSAHDLHYYLHDLNAEKHPSPTVTWTPGNMLSRHAPREPHTNQDGSFLCILPYLIINISDFLIMLA